MTQKNELTPPSKHIPLGMRMFAGAGIGLLLISLFVFSVREPNPTWGKFWMIRPLIIVPFAGAMGGLCNFILIHFRHFIGINKIVAVILSLIVFLVGLWMGMVLGLDGTLWD